MFDELKKSTREKMGLLECSCLSDIEECLKEGEDGDVCPSYLYAPHPVVSHQSTSICRPLSLSSQRSDLEEYS